MIRTAVGLVGVSFDMYFVVELGRRTMILTGFTGICPGMLLLVICTLANYQNNKALGGLMTFAGVMANFFATFQSTTSYARLDRMCRGPLPCQGGWLGSGIYQLVSRVHFSSHGNPLKVPTGSTWL
jgi:hypothetical protein